jgi:hypothetical protein
MRISRPLPIAIGFSLVLLTGVADATSTTCTTTVVCAEYINSSSGVAIHGEANTGIGIRGTSNGSTGFYGASRSGSPLFPGVEGESLNQSGDDVAGAFGLTSQTGGAAPYLGVIAYGSRYGVFGIGEGNGGTADSAPESAGVVGLDPGGKAGADTNAGVFGKSTNGTAVLALANATTDDNGPESKNYLFGYYPVGLYADGEPTQAGGGAVGVQAVSSDTPLEAYNPLSLGDVLLATSDGRYLIQAGNFFSVDYNGDVSAAQLTTTKGTYVRTTGSSGTTRMSYSARTTTPVMEDFGEAQLVDGHGYVKLDAALSDVIDERNTYFVFITPEGDSNGLYVSQKTPAGFTVREQRAGHSTLAFQYRILAKPVDDDSTRLALAPPAPHHDPLHRHMSRGGHAASQPSIDPFARLQARLGAAAYARELQAARKIETVP